MPRARRTQRRKGWTFDEVLRHTAKSVGRAVVSDDKVMQERLGHADISVTLGTYTETVTEQHRRAAEQLDELFN